LQAPPIGGLAIGFPLPWGAGTRAWRPGGRAAAVLPAAVLSTRTRGPCRPSSAAGDDLAFDLRQPARFPLGHKRRARPPAELARL